MADFDGEQDRVAENFAGKTLLITGGTGFVGKVLVEKLLRSCSDLKRIYLFVRTKKGKDPNERLKDIFSGPLYDMLKKQRGEEVLQKVEAVAADLMEPDLGLSSEDHKKLCEEVQIIYHCAATVRFDEALKRAVFMNVRGTKLLLELAKNCVKLEFFCHMSTAYCHLNERILHEKSYPPPADPHQVIKASEWLREDILDAVTDKILGNIPNTYAFTKALGEALVDDEMDKLPVVIVRPSVIIPIWKEPIPGWTDNLNGPTGLLIGAGKGVIRTMYCKGETYSDYVPVDIVVNALICISFIYKKTGKRIYNLTSSSEYKISFEEIIDIGRNIVSKNLPLNGVLWYPGGSMKKSRILHTVDFYLYQWIPAIILDVLLVLLGYKPVLKRVQRRIQKGYDVFEYYANNQWDFDNDETMKARELFNAKERSIYKLDGDGIDYTDYFTECVHAARLYVLKESDESIPAARRHMTIMWYVDKICKTLIVLGFFYLLYKYMVAPVFGMV